MEVVDTGFYSIKDAKTPLTLPDVIMKLVDEYNESKASEVDPSFNAQLLQLDAMNIFLLFQAAHHFKIKSLMDLTCRALVDRVRNKSCTGKVPVFVIPDGYLPRLRSHRTEAFISRLLGCGVGEQLNLASEYQAGIEMLSGKTEDPILTKSVAEFIESSEFVFEKDFRESVLRLRRHLQEIKPWYQQPQIREAKGVTVDLLFCKPLYLIEGWPIVDNILNLQTAIIQLEDVTSLDVGSSDFLCSKVASRLLQILKRIDFVDIQYHAAKIFARLRFDTCGDVINQAVPKLVELICSDMGELGSEVAITLARVAFLSTRAIHISHFQTVWDAFTKFKGRDVLDNLAIFLVFVCRGSDLSSSNKVKVVLPILEDLFSENGFVFKESQMVLACYALSYLTRESLVVLQDQTMKRLVEFTLHKSLSLSGAALGVVGNIVRWGCSKQFKCLIGDCQLLQCLRNKVLCSKFQKFRMEGCQIISNIAAQNRTYKNDIDEASLKCLLCKLLEEDNSDVRIEAAWAIFYMHCETYPLL